MGEPQPLDAQSTKLVLIALLRAVSRMKGVLDEPDRAVLKDMAVDPTKGMLADHQKNKENYSHFFLHSGSARKL